MKHLQIIALSVGLFFAGVTQTLSAATVLLNPVADGTLFSESGDLASGASNGVFVGVTDDGFERRAVVRFDLSAIPTNSVVQDASLTMYVTRTVSGNVNASLHRLSASWGEGSSSAGGSGGGQGSPVITTDSVSATWTFRFYNTTNWTTPGGDYNATPSATTSLGGASSTTGYTWSSGTLVSDVQSWIQTPADNNGWILIAAATGSATAKRLASREFATLGNRPALAITYSTPVPIPAAVWLMGSALFGLVGIARRRVSTAT